VRGYVGLVIASFPDRRFQLWEYRVSHGFLLVRSPGGPAVPRNIDLVFAGVEYMSVPRHLRGIVLEHGSAADRAAIRAATCLTEEGRVYALLAEGRRHLIAATDCKIDENDRDIFDTPFERQP
jgi:hypothetical protein